MFRAITAYDPSETRPEKLPRVYLQLTSREALLRGYYESAEAAEAAIIVDERALDAAAQALGMKRTGPL